MSRSPKYSPNWFTRHAAALLLLPLVLLFAFGSAHATWNIILTNPAPGSYAFSSIFFFNEQVGFVAGDAATGIFKTTDGGATWTQYHLNPGPGPGIGAEITSIRMTSLTHGWATVELRGTTTSGYAGIGLYETTNAGANWYLSKYLGDCTDVYQTPSAVTVTCRNAAQNGAVSLDGKNFTSNATLFSTNGLDFTDDLYGVAVYFRDTVWSRTTDGGRTWIRITPPVSGETWSVYANKGTSIFYTAGENNWDTGPSINSWINKSTDNGATWSKVSNLAFRTTGHIAGLGNGPLYVQAAYKGGGAGMYRSTDGGRAWVPVGGPLNDQDTRFCVLGCRGEIVIAFDRNGNVWKTSDGGDGAFPQFKLPALGALRVDSLTACVPYDTTLSLQNLGCDTIFIGGAESNVRQISVVDPSGGGANFPYTILPGGSGALRFRLQSDSAGPLRGRVIIAILRQGVYTYDTVTLTSAVRFANLVQTTPRLAFDSVSVCSSLDSAIQIVNPSCTTVQLLGVTLRWGKAYAFTSPSAIDSIRSGATKQVGLRFSPTQMGTYYDTVFVHLLVQGKAVTMAVPISGRGRPDNPQFVFSLGENPVLDFDTLTRCDGPVTKTFTITNPACTPLIVTNTPLQDTNHITQLFLPSVLTWNSIKKPDSLKLVDTLRLSLTVTPKALGVYRGYIRITYNIQGQPFQNLDIPYRVVIKPGTKTLSIDTMPHSFDSILFCAQKDVTVPVTNLGCDTLRITGTFVQGSYSLVNQPSLPVVLPPGSKIDLTFRYVPSVAGPAAGAFQITTDADSTPVRVVPFFGYAYPTDTVAFKAFTNVPTVFAGDTTDVTLVSSRSVANKGLNDLRITLRYNGDVMTPLMTSATTQVPGARVSVLPEVRIGTKIAYLTLVVTGTNLPLDTNRAIASIRFAISISDLLATEFSISQFALNNNSANFGKCVLGAVADSGTIAIGLACGNRLLSDLMATGKVDPESGIRTGSGVPYPNPIHTSSGESIRIPFEALRAVPARLELIDDRGVVVYTAAMQVSEAGHYTFTVPSSGIATGTFHYRITAADGATGVARGEIVVIK